MATTENKYTANGSDTQFVFTFPFLSTTDIKVSLNQVLTTAFTVTESVPTLITFNTAPANGVAVRIFRETNPDATLSRFFSSSSIPASDLNDNFDQALFINQELLNEFDEFVTTGIIDDSITTSKIADNAVTTTKIADANVTTAKVADAAITPAKLSIDYTEEAPSNGKQYARKDDAWSEVLPTTSSGDSPPANPTDGLIWWNSNDGRPYIWYEDADSQQWVEFVPADTTELTNVGYTYPGGVEQALQARLEQYVSVKDFGAVGDGVTDDTTAIQGAASSGKNISFEEGKVYKISAFITFSNNIKVEGNNSKLLSTLNTPNNTNHFVFGLKTVINNLHFRLDVGALAHRFIRINSDSFLNNITLSSAQQNPQGDDNIDGLLSVYQATNVSINNFNCSGIDKPIILYQASNVHISNFKITDFLKGIVLRESDHVNISEGSITVPSVNATTNPGHNGIGGGCEQLSINNVLISQSGEHGMYFAAPGSVLLNGLSINDCRIEYSGQCGVKVRGYNFVQMSNVLSVGCAYNNSLGTNEDNFRLENVSNIKISNCSALKGNKDRCGYFGMYINGCDGGVIEGCYFEHPEYAAIKIEDVTGDRVRDLSIVNNTSFLADNTVDLALTTTTATDINVANFIGVNCSAKAFKWDAAAGESGDNSVTVNLVGSIPSQLEEIVSGSPKWTISANNQAYYSSKTRQISGTQFTTTASDGSLMLSAPDATQGANEYNGALVFTGPQTTRSRAAVASYQPTTDPDQAGLVFCVRNQTTSSNDNVVPAVWIDNEGSLIQRMGSGVPLFNDNNQLGFSTPNNTTLRVSYKGTDGTTRSVDLTLS